MGFGSALAYYMVGFVIIGMIGGIFIVYQDYLGESTFSFQDTADAFAGKQSDSLNITRIFNHTGDVFVYVENTGQHQLDPNKTILFVNDKLIDLTGDNGGLYAGQDLKNPGLWGPGETMIFNISQFAPECDTLVRVVSEKGAIDEDTLDCQVQKKCRTESVQTTIPAGQIDDFNKFNTSLLDTRQAFLVVDSTGETGVSGANGHLVTAHIVNTTDVHLQRGAAIGTEVQVSYQLVECFNNEFWVQRGPAVIPATSLTQNATMNVTSDNVLVLVSYRSTEAGNDYVGSYVTADRNGSKRVKIERAVGTGAVVNARWEVVDFSKDSGVTVHTAEVGLSNGFMTNTSVLPEPVNLTNTWLYCSWDVTNNGIYQAAVMCWLPNASSVEVERHGFANYNNRVRYYAVEWPKNTVNVQTGQILALDPANTGTTPYEHNISITPVSLENSFVTITNTAQGTGSSYPRGRWTEYLINYTTIRTSLWRTGGAADNSNHTWQVVEFIDDLSPPTTFGE